MLHKHRLRGGSRIGARKRCRALAGGLNSGKEKGPGGTCKAVLKSQMSVCGGEVGGAGEHGRQRAQVLWLSQSAQWSGSAQISNELLK